MDRNFIVDICPKNHPEAEKFKKANEDLGHVVCLDKKGYFLILGGDRIWRAPDAVFKPVKDGLYVFETTH